MKPTIISCPVCTRPSNPEMWNLAIVKPIPRTKADKDESICMGALADLFERDIAELEATKQPGGDALCRKLKHALKEIRGLGRDSKGVNA